jgi:hypothetical protein
MPLSGEKNEPGKDSSQDTAENLSFILLQRAGS